MRQLNPIRLRWREAAFLGLNGWIRLRHPAVAAITPEQLARILAGEQRHRWLILDARTPAEFACSHLPGAVRIGAEGGRAGLGPLAGVDRETPIVVCCSVGVRSAARAEALRRAGFTQAANLTGGLFRWVREGRTLIRNGVPTRRVHPYGRGWGWLLPARNRGHEGP